MIDWVVGCYNQSNTCCYSAISNHYRLLSKISLWFCFTSLCGCLGTCAFPLSTNQMPTSRPIRFTTKTNHKFLTRSVAFSRVWGGKPAFTLGSSVLTPLMFFLALLAIAIALVRFMTLTQESVWKTLSWCRILCEKPFWYVYSQDLDANEKDNSKEFFIAVKYEADLEIKG